MYIHIVENKLIIRAETGNDGFWLGRLSAELAAGGWKYSYAVDSDHGAEIFIRLIKGDESTLSPEESAD